MRLTINRCPHHGYWSVGIDGEDVGRRITPSKCCGQWTLVRAWDLCARDWKDIVKLARQAVRKAEREEAKE